MFAALSRDMENTATGEKLDATEGALDQGATFFIALPDHNEGAA